MKTIVYTLLAAIFAITVTTSPVLAQSVESRKVYGFSSISSEGPFTVHVKIDGTESIKISTQPDVIELIETIVENGKLRIKFRDTLQDGQGNTDGPIDIYVTAKTLSSIIKLGSGFIDIDGAITGSKATIVLNGSGKITSSVKCNDLTVTITGPGTVRLNGMANKTETTINGPGELNGRNFKTKDASATITGSGNAYFTAEKTILAHVAGSGTVVYSGNAKVIGGPVKKIE
jgi:hypothetical protein